MKNLLFFVFIIFGLTKNVMADGMSLAPFLHGGVRFEYQDRSNRQDLLTAGVHLGFWHLDRPNYNHLTFLAPGVNFQTGDQPFALSISPIIWTGREGFCMGVDVFPFKSGSTGGGLLGVFIGFAIFP